MVAMRSESRVVVCAAGRRSSADDSGVRPAGPEQRSDQVARIDHQSRGRIELRRLEDVMRGCDDECVVATEHLGCAWNRSKPDIVPPSMVSDRKERIAVV